MATQSSVWLWNPYKTLDLNSLGRADFTCVGIAVSKPGAPRCRWKLDVEIQRKAREILDSMAVEQPLSQATTMALEELVSLLLCTERHKEIPEQKSGRISDWSAKIRDVPDEIEAKRAREIETQRETLSQIQHLNEGSSRFQEGLRKEGKEMPNSELRQRLKSVQQKVKESNTRSADLASEVIELQNQLKDKCAIIQKDLDTTKAELEETRRQLRNAEDNFEERSAKIIVLNTELAEANVMFSNKERNLKVQLRTAEDITATYDVSN